MFFLNETLAGLATWIRLLFIGLWTLADRAGRLPDRPKRIHAALFPYEPTLDVDEGLSQLAEGGLVTRYKIGGEGYIQISKWEKHQRPHHQEPQSEIPAPPNLRTTSDNLRTTSDNLRTTSDNLRTTSEVDTKDFGVNPPSTFNLQPATCNLQPATGDCNPQALADGAMPLDEFFEERYRAHPKKRDRVLAQQAMAGIPDIESNEKQDEFRHGHEAWIATDDYTWKGGAKCPSFAEFITDRTWRYPPSSGGGENGGNAFDRAIADWRGGAEEEAA